jgi:ATP-dependent Clp protease ATP-binding subunit ClpB
MRQDKFTTKFQAALADAQSLALGRDHQIIEPVHLLQALLDQQGGTVRPLLDKCGANINVLRARLREALDRLPKVEGTGGEVHLSNDLARLLNLTDKIAQKRGDQYITSELFVLAALEDKGRSPRCSKRRACRRPPSSGPSTKSAAAARSTIPAPRNSAARSRNTRST